jgi:hypothetical protein
VAIGALTLASLELAEGAWCYLTPEQIASAGGTFRT